MTTYECKECHKPVSVVGGQVHKDCKCDAPITANLKAVATGEGGVDQEPK